MFPEGEHACMSADALCSCLQIHCVCVSKNYVCTIYSAMVDVDL